MNPIDDHIVLDRVAVDIRATLALLKARSLVAIGALEYSDINAKRLNEVAKGFEDATQALLDEAVSTPRSWVISLEDWRGGRETYFRELDLKANSGG